jgi:hypothetical protein
VLTGGSPSSAAEHERLRKLARRDRGRRYGPQGAVGDARAAAPRADAGRLDDAVVLANTVRSLRGPLPAALVLDHIDALALNMARRAEGPESAVVRLAARVESILLRRWARRSAQWASAQVVTAEEDATHLWPQPPPIVLPIAWFGEPFAEPPAHDRDIDVIFTGSMSYPPNRAAAECLAAEILPRLRAMRPNLEVWIVGRGASELRLAPDVHVASDVPDLYAYLRRAKLAVAPLRGGTGAPNKVLEAAASGVALVAAPWVLERFDIAGAAAETPDDFASAIDRLLGDEPLRRATAQQASETLLAHSPAVVFGRLDEVLREAAGRA